MKAKFLGSMLLLASTMTMGHAYAASCGTSGGGLNTADVYFRLNPADDCYGPISDPVNLSGHDGLTYLNDNDVFTNTSYGTDPWAVSLKDDALTGEAGGSINFLGMEWTLTGTNTGVWSLSVLDPDPDAIANFPVKLDLAAVFKAGNGWAAYFFNDEVFNLDGSYTGSYSIAFNLNHNDIAPDLSHLDLFMRQSGGGEQQCLPGDTLPPCGNVPEPGILMLIGVGFLSLALSYSRRVAYVKLN